MAEGRKEPKAAERRDSRGRFAPGNRGRPPGTRNRVTGKLHQIFGKGAEAVAKATLEAAEGGDMAAARLVLERLFPPRRPGDHYLEIEMPTEPAEAMATVIEAVAGGRLLPSEGEKMATLIRAKADLATLAEIEQRLAALEERK